jgi:moderate conductance mechanosensitive channel
MRLVLPPTGRLVLLAMLISMAGVLPLRAPSSEQPAPPTSVNDLQALAASIEDEAKRKELLATIRALIAAKESGGADAIPAPLSERIVSYSAEAVRAAEEAAGDISTYFSEWPFVAEWIRREISDPVARAKDMNNAAAFVAIFAVGWFAEYLLWRILAGTRRQIEQASKRSGPARVLPIITRALVDLLPMLAFAGASYGTALFVQPTALVKTVGLNFVNAYLVARVLMAGARLLLSPAAPTLRALPLRDAVARDLFVWVRRFVGIGVVGYFVIAATVVLGLPRRGAEALVTVLGAVLLIVGIAFVLQHRRRVAGWLREKSIAASSRFGAAQSLQALAAVWHVLAIGYLVGFFIVAAFGIEGGFTYMLRGTILSLTIIAAAWLVVFCARWSLDRLLPPAVASEIEPSSMQSRISAYRPAISAAVRVVVVGLTGIALLQVWGIGVLDWLEQPVGKRVLGAAVSIALVLVVAVLAWEVASNAIERYLTTQDRDGGDLQRRARVRTLLPLMHKALFIFLSLMVVLISLSEIGVDIAPLLAGAGVIGLAIGFGAQKLVQDVITGVFMLVEDALSVGDVVNVAGTGGVVEDMSIRSIRLRDLSGNVHTIPFSSVGTVTNMTKDFSYYLLDIGVDYRQDPDQVMEVCKNIVDEMRKEPAFAYDILEPLDVLGVDQFAESAVLIKARIKTRPIKQWTVGREFNRRMKKRFDEVGIEIPYPHRTVYIANEKNDQSATLRVRLEGDAFPVQSTAQEPPPSVSPSRKRRTRKPEVARAPTNPPEPAGE